ncbi:uncharacterized protein LOC104415614 [Eucalyptus grandis]|uniref:Uncharacterized protein n=2 Tax=Eucalyptus grandis TaxID=71139 RepID=A0ACC3JWY6_EUCGR|nr:uncharacterized protein LOC104415614 [Eucalyptus grandis]KAK3418638.1 hypothetical protein EUGRSUZ_H04548 [Eucalyptus grandis]
MGLVLFPRWALLSTTTTILCIAAAAAALVSSEQMHSGQRSAYDVLGDYNFPAGILPIGVNGYDLDASTGQFAAYFNKTCSFSLEGSYQLEYKSTIRGLISENRLKNLQGVKVKLLFVWVDIVEVSRRGDDLQFSVGIAGADFPIDNFEECPQCGCGLNCGDRVVGETTRGGRRPFVDSY